MSKAFKWLRQLFVSVLVLVLLASGAVFAIRWWSDTPEARAAVARMEQAAAPVDGENGSAWLAFVDRRIPMEEIPAALAEDVAAFADWHAAAPARLAQAGDPLTGFPATDELAAAGGYASPVLARYPERPRVEAPEAACSLRELHCLAKVSADPDAVQAWLDADAERLELARRALAATHLRYPYAPAIDSPIASLQHLRLPLNQIALQAARGDAAGALPAACRLLVDVRRHGRLADTLITKLVTLALVDGAAGLVLDLVRAQPGAPLPADCEPALAEPVLDDYAACEAMRFEYRMNVDLGGQLQAPMRASLNPLRLAQGWLLMDQGLQARWAAQGFGDVCSEDYRAGLARGEVPAASPAITGFDQLECYGAAVSCVLSSLAAPAYDGYQRRMLDHAAKHRLLIALARQAQHGLEDAAVATTAASPGYALAREGADWVLTLQEPRSGDPAAFRVPGAATPSPLSDPASAATTD